MVTFDVDQQDWGSRFGYNDGTLHPWHPDKWVIHYGGGPNEAGARPYDPDLEAQVLRSWQRYHVDIKGWRDIAYNYAIGQSGLVYRCRGENRSGATAGDHEPDGVPENHEARAVVFILGGTQRPSAAALDTFRRLYRDDPAPVIGHRFVFESGHGGSPTACPGAYLTEWIRAGGYLPTIPGEPPMSFLPLRYGHGYQTPPQDSGLTGDQRYKRDDVKLLQIRLNDVLGVGSDVDGVYGPEVQELVATFMASTGGGISKVGAGIWNKLDEEYNFHTHRTEGPET